MTTVSKYNPCTVWSFDVTGPFGRVITRHHVRIDETHHRAAEAARMECLAINNAGKRAWVKLRKPANQ